MGLRQPSKGSGISLRQAVGLQVDGEVRERRTQRKLLEGAHGPCKVLPPEVEREASQIWGHRKLLQERGTQLRTSIPRKMPLVLRPQSQGSGVREKGGHMRAAFRKLLGGDLQRDIPAAKKLVGPPAHEAQGRVGDEGGGVKDELRREAEEGGTITQP
jgi:hypothetical protein